MKKDEIDTRTRTDKKVKEDDGQNDPSERKDHEVVDEEEEA